MTNVTISISTSLIFRSLVVIFQLRPPMASLFSRLYICPGLLVVLMLYPEGDKLLEQRYVKEGLKSSLRKFFYGRYGDLIKQYEVSFTNVK